MKRLIAAVGIVALLASPAYAGVFGAPTVTNAATAPRVEFSYIFAGGGTPLTNGVFFPGTATCSGGECTAVGAIPQIKKGTDITFANMDEGTVSNAHRIVCLGRTKTGRPKCVSEQLDSPGETSLMVTSKLRPGLYPYLCSVHFGMYGIFEVVK